MERGGEGRESERRGWGRRGEKGKGGKTLWCLLPLEKSPSYATEDYMLSYYTQVKSSPVAFN